jgi:hypothetical protein
MIRELTELTMPVCLDVPGTQSFDRCVSPSPDLTGWEFAA